MREAALVTGADGFIGRHLVTALEARGRRVVRHSMADGDLSRAPLSYSDVDHVLHLAGKTFVPESWEAPFGFYATNVLGALNALEFCRHAGASMTLMSTYVYGRPQRLPVDESHPVDAWNPYCHTKLMAEDAAGFYSRHFAVNVTILRPFNIYGPGQSRRFLIPSLIAQALDSDSPEIVVADSRPRRDQLHVSDLVALLVATSEQRIPGVFNVGSGVSYSIADLVETINGITGCRKPLRDQGRGRAVDVLDTIADISKSRHEFGWQPVVTLEAGIRGMIADSRSGRDAR